jgi:hypothetical protein
MKRTILVCTAAVVFAGSAWAQGKEAAPPAAPPAGMDMMKMGPAARKPTDEKKTKKEIDEFFKKNEENMMKGDLEAAANMIDFPIYMATDDLKGVPEAKESTREQYMAMMKPFYEHMPKGMKMTHKPTVTVLSDSLVAVTDDFTTTGDKMKMSGRNAGLLVKRDGQWKWKTMVEAGWGGMPMGADKMGGDKMMPEGKK